MLIESFITSPQYRHNLFKDDRYSVVAVTCVQDILDEAKSLKHCVASYISNYIEGGRLFRYEVLGSAEEFLQDWVGVEDYFYYYNNSDNPVNDGYYILHKGQVYKLEEY